MAGLRLVGIAAVFPILRTIGLDDQRDAAGARLVNRLRTLLTGRLVIFGASTRRRQWLTLCVGSAEAGASQIGVGVLLDGLSTQQPVAVERHSRAIRVGHKAPCIVAERAGCTLRRQPVRIIGKCLLGEPLASIAGDRPCEVGRSGDLAIGCARIGDEGLAVRLGSVDVAHWKRQRAAGDIWRNRNRPSPAAAGRGRATR
jgi:hypothetical protein